MILIFIPNLTNTKMNQEQIDSIDRTIFSIDKINKVNIVVDRKNYEALNSYINNKKYKTEVVIIPYKKLSEYNQIKIINDIIISSKAKDDIIIVFNSKIASIDINKVKRYFEAIKKPIVILHQTNDKKLIKKNGEYYLDKDKFIKSFRNNSSSSKTGLISAGIYMFPKDSLFWFGKFLKSGSEKINFGYLIKKISQKRKIRGIIENEKTAI
jgi:hypothetical protein